MGQPNPIVMKVSRSNAVEITYQLETAVREDVYEYLIERDDVIVSAFFVFTRLLCYTISKS